MNGTVHSVNAPSNSRPERARRARPRRRGGTATPVRWTWVIWGIACVVLSAVGCAEDSTPRSPLPDQLPPPKGDQRPTEPTPADAPPAQPGTETGGETPADAEPKSVLPVRTLDLQTSEARQALEQNFEGFLEREDIGLSREAAETVGDGLSNGLEALKAVPERLRTMSPWELVEAGFPLMVVAAFMGGFLALTRQIGRFSHRAQARVHLNISRWTTRLLRGAILVTGRCLSVAILVGLSYFPIQAIFRQAPWTQALTAALWLLLLYRLIGSFISIFLSGRLVELSDENARRLETFARESTRVIFGFLITIAVLESLEFAPAYLDVVRFGLRISVVGVPVGFALMKEATSSLLPEDLDSRFYPLLRRFLVQNFTVLMGIAAALLILRAAGFVRASTFILSRGFALIGLALAAFIAGATSRDLFRRRVDILEPEAEAPLETDHGQLSHRLDQLLSVAGFIVVLILSLRLLRLLEPTSILLRTPFLAVGQAQISLMKIINVGLVIFGTVLGFKLVRAVLNAKVYPVLEVDIGIAYAVNTVVKYFIILVAFLLALSALGINLTALTVVLASLGVGIGFGLQNLVENLISGFIILFGRSVQKGDFITVEGTYGQVEAVGARSVVITTPDNYEMLIPSKEIVGGRIINWSYDDNMVRAVLPVGVAYDSEPRVVEEVLVEATEKHPLVLDEPKPRVRLAEFGDSSVNFEVLFFFDCRNITERQIIGEINFDIWEALADEGITIPFPQRDLHIKSEQHWERLQEVADKVCGGDDEPAGAHGGDGGEQRDQGAGPPGADPDGGESDGESDEKQRD